MKKLSIDKEYNIIIIIALIVLVPLWLGWFNLGYCGLFGMSGNLLCDSTRIFFEITPEYFLYTGSGTSRISCVGSIYCINPKLALLTAFFIVVLLAMFIYKRIKHKK